MNCLACKYQHQYPWSGWLWPPFLMLYLTTTSSILHRLLQHLPSHCSLEKSCLCPPLCPSLLIEFPSFSISSCFFLSKSYSQCEISYMNFSLILSKEIVLPPLIDCKSLPSDYSISHYRNDPSIFPTSWLVQLSVSPNGLFFT